MKKSNANIRISFHSMGTKAFIQICVLMVLPVIILTLFANHINQDSLLQQKRAGDLRILRNLSAGMSLLLQGGETAGKAIARDRELHDFLRACWIRTHEEGEKHTNMNAAALLSRYEGLSDDIAAYSILDKEGHFLGETRLDAGRLSWVFNFSVIGELDPHASRWTVPFTLGFTESGRQERVMASINPARDTGGELLGYVVVYLRVSSIKRLFSGIEDEIYVLDPVTNFVASKEDFPFYHSIYDVRQIAYTLLIEDNSVIVELDNGPVVITTQSFAQPELKFLLVSSYNDILAEANQRAPSVAALGIYMLLFSLVAALFISRSVTGPAVKLMRVMNKVSHGDFSVRYKTRSKDEIARLGEAFNELLDHLGQLMRQIYAQQEMERKLQLQLIQEQVRPHFLYNVLEMISSLVRDGMTAEALAAIQHLTKFYRVSLNRGLDVITVAQELALCESYLALQRLRYMEFMDYTLSVAPHLGDYRVPKLSLQPIIENAIYHGIKSKGEKCLLCVSVYREEERIVFEIFDNGLGMPAEKLGELNALLQNPNGEDSGQHFGLASVVKRLNLFCDNKAKMTLYSEEGQFTNVTLSLPAIKEAR